MYLFDLFRSFLPLRNPIGFGVGDFVELALAGLLVLAIMTRCWTERWLRRMATKTLPCILFLGALSIALRLLLLPHSPAPTPSGSDDFSYVLLGDTLAHLRLANPTHPLHQFFETIFVLQQPSYSSIYPLGQGIALALGRLAFGSFWVGILLSVALLSALCYWMLRAWVTPGWALTGGLLAVMEFGPLSSWTNSYWGGAVSGVAGCLVFGALPRLCDGGGRRAAALFGVGLGLEMLTRPFESILLVVCVLLFFVPELRGRFDRKRVVRAAVIALLALSPAIVLTLAQNRAVTGSWTTLPYMLSRYEYGVPTSFTFQPNPVPHRELTEEQEMDYRAQSAIHGDGTDTVQRFVERWVFRLRYYRFYFFPPLYFAGFVFAVRVREWRFLWVLVALVVFTLGTNIYPYFYPHYVAAVTCLCVLVSVKGLERLSAMKIRGLMVGWQASRLILFLCATQFLFWYGLHWFGGEEFWPALRYETSDFINYGDAEGRIAINDELRNSSGQQLVFVRYWPQHKFEEWIHNAADIDASRIVWARDLGAVENQKLIAHYPSRKTWLLEPDTEPPRLTAYESLDVGKRSAGQRGGG